MIKLILLLALVAGAWLMWRRRGRRRPPALMPPAEARALLGVGEQASLDDIREAHRRLIARVHPDTGGSAELAARVNDARDALVEELRRRTVRSS
jgi:DnaJ family protein C protein 19